jgi:hypothetical protein
MGLIFIESKLKQDHLWAYYSRIVLTIFTNYRKSGRSGTRKANHFERIDQLGNSSEKQLYSPPK